MKIDDILTEALKPSDPVEKWIAVFKASTHPKFAGKTPEQRERQARMAHYRAVQNKKTFKEAGGPDMSRRGFLGGLGALLASSGLPKVAAGALQQILGITTPEHLENMQYALKSRGTLLQLTNDELDKISSAIKGAPLDTWPGFRGTHKSVYGNPLIDQAYRKLTGEEMKAARVARILKDSNIDPMKFFESPSVKAVIEKVRQEWAAKWAQSGASDDPFKDPDYEPPKMDDKKVKKLEKKRDRAYKELTAKKDDRSTKGTAVGRMGPIQAPLKPTHISPSGVATNMSPKDDDYEINYGAKGVAKKPTGRFVKPLTGKAK